MLLHINISLGANVFNVNGDVSDLPHIVELFTAWVTAQQSGDSDPAKLAEITARFKANQEKLKNDVTQTTPA